uniref:MICOS complex subunit MIC19 n=1 Tax=Serinus canaria TaxID=9135 RepID=A0A8C9NHI2_SERCA
MWAFPGEEPSLLWSAFPLEYLTHKPDVTGALPASSLYARSGILGCALGGHQSLGVHLPHPLTFGEMILRQDLQGTFTWLVLIYKFKLDSSFEAEHSFPRETQSGAISAARQLEEKDRELRKHDAYYKEQLARLEERSAQFYKVTTEQYQKAADEVSARFKRYESHPICGELQDKILQCYREHAQETLSCSALASQYLRCVNHAKQRMLGRGG